MFDVTITRGRAEALQLTLSRNSGLGQLDTGDTARLVVYVGSAQYLNLVTGIASDDGSTLEVSNGLPTPGDEAAALLLKLTAAETDAWPTGILSAELLVADSTDDREYTVEDGRVTVLESASANGVLTPIVGFHELMTLTGAGATDADRRTLQQVQGIVESQVRQYLNWDVTQQTRTEFHPSGSRSVPLHPLLSLDTDHRAYLASQSHGLDAVTLHQGYVRSVTEVVVNEAAASPSDFDGMAVVASSEYTMSWDEQSADGSTLSITGMLYRLTGNWPIRARSMRVTYVNGFTPAELATDYADIKGAVAEEVAGRLAAAQKLVDSAGEFPVSSFSFGGYSESYDSSSNNALSIVRGQLAGATKAQLKKYRHLKLGA